MTLETQMQTLTAEIQKLNGIMAQFITEQSKSTKTFSSAAPTTTTATKTETTKATPAPSQETPTTTTPGSDLTFEIVRDKFNEYFGKLRESNPEYRTIARELIDRYQTKAGQPVLKTLMIEEKYQELYAELEQRLSEMGNG